MKLFSVKNLKYFLGIVLFVGIYIATHRDWYLTLSPITFGDTGFLYRDFFADLFNTLSPAWNGGINFGANSATALPYFGFNFWGAVLAKFGFDYNPILRGILFYPLLIAYAISVLFVAREFKNSVVALVFGLVFSVNTLIIVVWLNMLAAYTFLPLIFFTLYKYLSKKKIVWLLIFSLFFTFTLFYEIRVGFISLLLSAFFTIFYWIYNSESRKVYLKQFLQLALSLVIVFLLGAFFTFPLFHKESFSAVSSITSQPLFGTSFYGLQYSISLMHPFWDGETFQVFQQQPVKFYFWIYPILAFSALFFAKKDKKIIYFSLIAIFGIFMGKGANIPFGFVYSWSYYHLPFFNFFREPVQWWVTIGFSYAVLIAYFFYYFYQEIEGLVRRRFPNAIFLSGFTKILVTLPILFVTLSIAIPAYDGRLGRELNSVTFAKEYDLFRQFLLNRKDYFRTLSIPTSQRFIYYSSSHPNIAYNYLPENLKSLNTKLLSLESIRYVVLPDDVLNDVFINTYSNKQYENFINTTKSNREYEPLKEVEGFGKIKLWENPNDIPHLMAVKDLVYITGPKKISEVAGIPTSKQVAYYSEQEVPASATEEVKELLTNQNSTMYKNSTKLYSVADCVRCDLNKNYYNYVKFPFARILPDSLLYPLIEMKEDNILSSLASPEEKFKMDAFFAEKRAIEIQRLKMKPFVDSKYIISALIEINKLFDDMENKFSSMNNGSIDNGFLATWDYLYTERRTLDDLYQSEHDKQIKGLLSKTTSRIDGLIAKISQRLWVTKGDEKKMTVNLPEEGNYEIFIKDDDGASFDAVQLAVDDKNFQKTSAANNGLLSFGNYIFNEGRHYLKMDIAPTNLLELASFSNDIVETDTIRIKNLKDSQSQYQLSFDYKITGGRSGRIFISDDAFPINPNTSNGNLISDSVLRNHNDEQWHHFNMSFTPYVGVVNPVLHLKGEVESSGAVFRNFSLTKVITPTIVFAKDTGKVLETPKITYQEITSTDYTLKIENAKGPFLLSFSEQFDNNWSTLSTDNQSFYGANQAISTYFDGNVKEVSNLNRLEPAVLMGSLIRDSKMNALHVGLNGFSNGWLIDKNGTYQIHLTFSPHKYFIVGLVVSALTFGVVILAIVFLLLKKRKKS